jgi:hypothetical protein
MFDELWEDSRSLLSGSGTSPTNTSPIGQSLLNQSGCRGALVRQNAVCGYGNTPPDSSKTNTSNSSTNEDQGLLP